MARYATVPPESELAGQRAWIDTCYDSDSVPEILARLRDHGGTAAKEAAAAVESKSPTSLKVTLAALRRARDLTSLEAALEQEYRTSVAALSSPDFAEGVRARIIDKDRSPRWSPGALEEVSEEEVARHFAPPDSGDLRLDVRI